MNGVPHIYEFLSAVAEDDEFSPSFATAYEIQRVLDAIEQSDARGERVLLDRHDS